MSIRVIRPGLLTTIQDLGRYGSQQFGVIVSGAMDPLALRISNLLVGNEQYDAVLEITLSGPALLFEQDALIAITGAHLSAAINGQAVPLWRPNWVRQGSLLEFGAPISGCRAYLSVAGGFDVPLVMHSRSTYLRARLGGFDGRPLQTGDLLNLRSASSFVSQQLQSMSERGSGRPFVATDWFAGLDLADYTDNPTIRVITGGQYDWFDDASRETFVSEPFSITSQSDRMGYRLAGPTLRFIQPRELISEAVTMGTVQVPPEGQPIILMADRPTTGGYAKIAQVATVDLPALAQLKPGAKIRFLMISVEEAQELYRSREAMMRRLGAGIAQMNF
jgi:antagonist of KipI